MSAGLVIGAGGGIGGACVAALASSAAPMIVVDRDDDRLGAATAAAGEGAVRLCADIARPEGRAAILAALKDAAPLRWAVLASGLPLRGKLANLDPDDIVEVFEANLIGPTLLLRALSDMRWATPASVVVIGSVSASRSLVARSAYAASKAGLERLAMSLGAEWAARGIRVNVVAPGVIGTSFLGPDSARLGAWVADRVPAARTGTPAEVAALVRYLVLDAPNYIVGARISIDGGMEATA